MAIDSATAKCSTTPSAIVAGPPWKLVGPSTPLATCRAIRSGGTPSDPNNTTASQASSNPNVKPP